MISEIQFKGLYSGRLAYVESADCIGYQVFGVACLKFNQELAAEQRVRALALIQKAKTESAPFSFIFEFPDDVEFSSVDMNLFKEIYIICLEWGSQFSIICGLNSMQMIKGFGRTQSIDVFNTKSEAFMNIKSQFLKGFTAKMTRNIIVTEKDSQIRELLVTALLKDRFSAVGVNDQEEAENYVSHFKEIIDGAILEMTYPEYKEIAIVEKLKAINADAKLLVHTDVMDSSILAICQKFNINTLVKSPYKVPNLITKYKVAFPERQNNFLGFKE